MSNSPLANRWLKAGAVALVLVAVAIFVRVRFGALFDPKVAAQVLTEARSSPWALPGFLVAYVVLTSAFAPASVFHLAAAAVWGFAEGLAINLFAFHLTCNLQFAFTRRFGAAWAKESLGEARVRALEQRLGRDGLRAAMLVRLLPVPAMAVSVAGALSPLRWRDFAIGSLIGTLPVIVVPTAFAVALVKGAEGAQSAAFVWMAISAVAVLLLAVVTRLLSRRVTN